MRLLDIAEKLELFLFRYLQTYTVSINPPEFWYISDLRSGWPDQVDILGGENRDR